MQLSDLQATFFGMPYQIQYIDRITGKKKVEKIYGDWALRLLYEKCYGRLLLPFIAKISFFSKLYGFLQSLRCSKKKIRPFIKAYHLQEEAFEKKVEGFTSFNDFFTRKLKPEARPIDNRKDHAILPTDARYFFFNHIDQVLQFHVKGKSFTLPQLLHNERLAKRYEQGSMVVARLAPMDYHRFHFPFDALAKKSKKIDGPLYSVNPLALRKNWHYLCQNKRVITLLESEQFGDVAFIEIGATYVGTIHQTFTPNTFYKKGEEKGFFSFGGSCIIILFEKDKIQFDQDLIEASLQKIEIRGLLGQSMGKTISG